VKGAVPGALVPPQPNLGPEPWPDESLVPAFGVAASAVTSLLLGWILWRLFRRRRARRAQGALAGGQEADGTPKGQFLALAATVREALIRQYGTEWRAKTTEELSEDGQLEQALGREPVQELVRFLNQVDLLKFAPERSNHQDRRLERELGTWKPLVADLVVRIQAKPDGRVKGRNPDKQARSSSN
jgi:hypothetical protein